MGTTILDGALIGAFSLIGAGSLVTQGTVIPPKSKAWGRPAKVVGELTKEEIDRILWNADHYKHLSAEYLLDGA
jgi:carbonic anhydrase/acetyltransferase-like protein (isoleucine patch superfamily)